MKWFFVLQMNIEWFLKDVTLTEDWSNAAEYSALPSQE